ncbi:MAG: Fic family protein [Candidatus Adiutrix sp.]|jgi:Fic family protein|nr:Fic family protein [Candidatus Adiutrix sp.]
MLQYFWQSEQWPHYRWRAEDLLAPLAELRKTQGRVLGLAASLGFDEGLRATALALEEDAMQTAAIEGERLDREKVRSSIALRLALPSASLPPLDRAVDGLVEVLLDATRQYDQALDQKRLCGWHAALFPTGRSGLERVTAGAWRTAALRVLSGPFGKQKVHFEAPPPERLPGEMKTYFAWWRESRDLDGLIRAALAHLYFVTIHPFDDGNGRLARALSDLALAQDEGAGRRFYSLSAQIMKERREYYRVLERTQKNDGDCTEWLLWFFGCLTRAIEGTGQILATVLLKARFWQKHAEASLINERQRKVLNRLLDAGPGGFEGGLSTRKYMSLTKTSRATAWREIDDLLKRGLLAPRPGGGRSTAYDIDWPAG